MAIGAELSERDRMIVELVAAFGAVSARQIEQLFFVASSDQRTAGRLTRRTLGRLVESGLLARLERRIGGVRAGSAGYVYRVGPQGRRLVAYWSGQGLPRGRRPHEPGRLFVRHQLAVCELYLGLVQAERRGQLELLAFDAEPACWRSATSALGGQLLLKPDAYVRVACGSFEERAFLEVDLGTEGHSTLRRKARAYLDYYRSGQETAEHGVFPRVVWVTTNRERCAVITRACSELPAEAWGLFAVTTTDGAVDLIAGELTEVER